MVRIAIVGAGISGLSQYLWLRKLDLLLDDRVSVHIYEAREAQGKADFETYNASVIGASIGISPTGLHVLKRLDQGLYEEILKTGHIIRRWRVSNARGWTLDMSPVGGENEIMVMIGREACCQILRKRVPDEAIQRRKVSEVKPAQGENGPTLVFQDQRPEEFDMVIGCDGIWSRVRRAIFGAQGRDEYEYSPHYEGLIGVGGFIPSSKIAGTPDGEMNVVLGANGFFGYGYTTGDPLDPAKAGGMATWWSTYALNQCPDDWRKIDKEAVKKELQMRHHGWKNPAIRNIIQDVEVDSLYPTFITPLLPTWEKGGCVLVGDAAHALQPSSGQGASMALEDCEALALLIRHHLRDIESAYQLAVAAQQYSDLRRPRLDSVYKKAQQLAAMKQDMGFVGEMIMYLFVWISSRLKLSEAYNRQLNAYDVPTEVFKAVNSA